MLGAPAETQLAYLRKLGTYPSLDELALEFDDEYGRVRPEDGPDENTLSPDTAAALAALDAKLTSMSRAINGQLWQPPALHGPEWSQTRSLALAALAALSNRRGQSHPPQP